MRLTLARPYLAISSNSPSTMAAEALSASISTARCFCWRGTGVLAMSASLQVDVRDHTAKCWLNAIYLTHPPACPQARLTHRHSDVLEQASLRLLRVVIDPDPLPHRIFLQLPPGAGLVAMA